MPIEFVPLFCVHCILLVLLIRWRGLNSAEGMGFLILSVSVVSDGVGLLIAWAIGLAPTATLVARMTKETVPTLVHILGLGALALGLLVTDPSSPRLSRILSSADRQILRMSGFILVAAGLAMKLLALYLWGIRSLGEYINQLYAYDISTRQFGFLDQGVTLTIFGFGLLTVADDDRPSRQVAYVVGALACAFLLSTNKSALFLALIPFVMLTRTFSLRTYRRWARPWVVGALGAVLLVSLGLKAQLKYHAYKVGTPAITPQKTITLARNTLLLRFSQTGLYDGYVNLVNRLNAHPMRTFNGAVAEATFAGVIPRFIYTDILGHPKPDHPFHAKGDLINNSFAIDVHSNDAPTLVGFAFADFRYTSVIIYLFAGGLFLGVAGRLARGSRSIFPMIAYIYWASSFALPFAESGLLNAIYYALTAVGVTFGIAVMISAWTDFRDTAMAMSHLHN